MQNLCLIMKKLPFSFFKMLPLALLICSCSSDDDNNSGINGKWLYAGQYNSTTETYLPQSPECNTRTFIIKSQGTALLIRDNCTDELRESFMWKQIDNSDVYSFTKGDFTPENVRLTLSAASDTLRMQAVPEDAFTDVYIRQ